MIVGMYTSASGMLAQAARHDTIANNLANVSTPGFKADAVMMSEHPKQFLHRLSDNLFNFKGFVADPAPAIGSRGQGTMIDSILPNFKQGTIINTHLCNISRHFISSCKTLKSRMNPL